MRKVYREKASRVSSLFRGLQDFFKISPISSQTGFFTHCSLHVIMKSSHVLTTSVVRGFQSHGSLAWSERPFFSVSS